MKGLDFLSHRFNLLERAVASSSQDTALTPLQGQVDGLVNGFVRQASDWKALAAMTAGSVAFRLGKVGVMAAGTEFMGAMPLRMASFAVGLGAEVSAYEGVSRTLMSGSWRWSGPQGIKAGLTSSFITFVTLKTGGRFAQGQNLILQHGIQDLAMVAGHELIYRAGKGPRPEGSFAQRMLHAEVTNLELGAGMALGHSLTGGHLQALEGGLDLSLRSLSLARSQRVLFAMAGTLFSPYLDGPFLMKGDGGKGDGSRRRPSWLKVIRGGGSASPPGVKVAEIPRRWAEERLQWPFKWRDIDQLGFELALERLPNWFLPHLAHLFPAHPLTARALFVRLELLPKTSFLNGDSQVVRELSQQARQQMSEAKWRRHAEQVLNFYELTAPDFFPKTYKDPMLIPEENRRLMERLGDLPPSLLIYLCEIPLSYPAYFLSLLHRLGISDLGDPVSPTPPPR
jgi:hypothetical protein